MSQRLAIETRNFVSKNHKLAELQEKYSTIKSLIERNKGLSGNEGNIIRFPFIGTLTSELKEVFQLLFRTASISMDKDYVSSRTKK